MLDFTKPEQELTAARRDEIPAGARYQTGDGPHAETFTATDKTNSQENIYYSEEGTICPPEDTRYMLTYDGGHPILRFKDLRPGDTFLPEKVLSRRVRSEMQGDGKVRLLKDSSGIDSSVVFDVDEYDQDQAVVLYNRPSAAPTQEERIAELERKLAALLQEQAPDPEPDTEERTYTITARTEITVTATSADAAILDAALLFAQGAGKRSDFSAELRR